LPVAEREDVSSDAADGETAKQDVDSSDVDINAMLEEIEVSKKLLQNGRAVLTM
jgi:hypothetical protein